jgi:glycosyltransferase involved in cell wall biosynthesis
MRNLLVIPAFNEEPTLPGLIAAAKGYFHDILVIDDGSSDATTLVSVMGGAMTHRFAENRGKGEALKAAFEYAISQGYDWVFTMDGDGQHAPTDLPNFFPALEHYDLILGNRMNDRKGVPLLRRTANFVSSLLVSAACGQWIYDSQTGFRAYSSKLLRAIPLQSSRYELETEVIIKAVRRGFRVGHVTIQTIYAGETSRFKNLQDSLRFLRVVAKSLFWR